ncbi:MAG: glucose-6-phosphate dehydrogenase [Candidatus Ryanbacteria bacterium CG10_big_fil_rev_8_21_14_0_10_43_42]|uniref:Glucose-6-phosphate 1-dehydrogenase n=1 Tax=Candidatus Ryanbacteria bacterium CG10_big_fil_rev_8_21_14_0_10_43_42 TaxID=1974864 RepID=A0A2M8KWN2_9BACT|nr:MAG: glucose-6-phosphate dehydrogenase [Candidatus Ryanbacteria bacterium CG10_big_fil_rev_8_21_14_0_10_43_42]
MYNDYMESPTTFVIFGATGDLARKKLIPALFDLYVKKMLPDVFYIMGFSRRVCEIETFHDMVRDAIGEKMHNHAKEKEDAFLKHVSYVQGSFEDAEAYKNLAEALITLDNILAKKCSNKIFYLAVPPISFASIFTNLADAGLSIPCVGGWTRILVEKPFGKDLHTAQELDATLGLLFKEEQIFRIDHYLAKETIQNIIAFRFANTIFGPLWDKDHIEKVEVQLLEDIDVGTRGSFYDGVGALRDLGQSHILQMVALIAMEDPKELDASLIRAARAKVFTCLRPFTKNDIKTQVVRGQYVGYRDTKGVDPNSATETYFRMKTYIDNERWRDVPFYLEAGKALHEKRTEITLYFREKVSCVCPKDTDQHHQNMLTIRLQPNEGMSLLFWVKKPGFGMDLEPQRLSFSYADSPNAVMFPDAYERVLHDCVRGDQTLFASTEEVNAEWKFITPILQNWQDNPLMEYEKGSKPKHTIS